MGLLSSRIAQIATGASKNWASCHPMKPVRQPPSKRPPELQNRAQTIRAGTNASVSTPDSTSAIELRASLFEFLTHFLRGFRYERQFYSDMDSSAING